MLTAVTFMVMDDLAIRWRGQPAWVGWVWLSLIGAGLVLAVYVFQGAGRALNRGRTAVRNRGQMIAGLVIAGFVLLGFARLALQMVGCR